MGRKRSGCARLYSEGSVWKRLEAVGVFRQVGGEFSDRLSEPELVEKLRELQRGGQLGRSSVKQQPPRDLVQSDPSEGAFPASAMRPYFKGAQFAQLSPWACARLRPRTQPIRFASSLRATTKPRSARVRRGKPERVLAVKMVLQSGILSREPSGLVRQPHQQLGPWRRWVEW